MPTHTVTHEGTFRAAQEKTYVHLPFEVSAGATRLEVRCAYTNRIGSDPLLKNGNTIDLGVFDARGIGFLDAGFRGWSGSERASFVITETEATPGYLPGALLPGTWYVLLGLYKLAPEGCAYRVDVTVTSEPGHVSQAGLPAPVAALPASFGGAHSGAWLRGEMHCHSDHSDGEVRPVDLVRMAREARPGFSGPHRSQYNKQPA